MTMTTLFFGKGTALLSGYASGSGLLRPGALESWPFFAAVTRDAAGNTVKLKLQGTQDSPEPLAVPGEGGSLLVAARDPDTTFRCAQGTALSYSHALTGRAIVLILPVDVAGRPAGTVQGAGTYLSANLAAELPTISASGLLTAPLREGLQELPVPVRARWADLLTLRQSSGAEQVEHEIDATAGASVVVAFTARYLRGLAAVRIQAKATAAPAAADELLVTTMTPGRP